MTSSTASTAASISARASDGIPLRRRVSGALRIAAGLLVFAGMVTQITDLTIHDAFVPGEYFSFFTIESSLMNTVVLVVGGIYALRHRIDTTLLATVAAAIVPYAIVTGAVYNALLRGLPAEGYRGAQWPNEVMHVVIPIVILLDWLLSSGRPRLGWRALWVVASYPIAWLIFTLIRGAATGWYPYPFLDPDGPNGVVGVLIYIVVLTAFILAVGALAILRTRLSRSSEPHSPTLG